MYKKHIFHVIQLPLIENLEIKINGQSRQNINQYGYIYNILHDFTCGHDAVAKNRIGCNADPSLKSVWRDGQVRVMLVIL
jgi:hypothetical protein